MNPLRYRRYKKAVANVSKLAQAELARFFKTLPNDDPDAVRDALLRAVPAIVGEYDKMAALCAAQYYEAERAEAVGGRYRATFAAPVDAGAIEQAVRYACGHLYAREGEAIGAKRRR